MKQNSLLPGTETSVLVRARLALSPRVRFRQYVPDPVKARLTVSKHVSPTSVGLQTVFWATWQVGSATMVQTSVGMLRAQEREREECNSFKGKTHHISIQLNSTLFLLKPYDIELSPIIYPYASLGVSYCFLWVLWKVRPW